MGGVLMALVGDSLIRGAVRGAAGLALAVLLAMAFAIAAVMSLAYAAAGVLPGASAGPTARVARPPLPGAPATGVVAVASQYLGMPYVWGGSTPATSFDCSGLTQWSYGQVGLRLPRIAQMQFDATARVPTEELQPGDLVFFRNTYKVDPAEPITHVGLYLGDGQMINAPVEGKPISVQPVFAGFWGAHFAGGGRPIG